MGFEQLTPSSALEKGALEVFVAVCERMGIAAPGLTLARQLYEKVAARGGESARAAEAMVRR